MVSPNQLELLSEKVRGGKTYDTDTPGSVSKQLLGLFQKFFEFRRPEQAAGEEWKSPRFADFGCEGWSVTHPRHRPLHNGITCAVRTSEWCFLIEGLEGACVPDVGVDSLPDSLQHPSHRSEPLSQGRSESRILPKEPDVPLRTLPANPRLELLAPSGQNFRSRTGILNERLFQFNERFNRRKTRPRINSADRTKFAP